MGSRSMPANVPSRWASGVRLAQRAAQKVSASAVERHNTEDDSPSGALAESGLERLLKVPVTAALPPTHPRGWPPWAGEAPPPLARHGLNNTRGAARPLGRVLGRNEPFTVLLGR